ncbi:MAG TPA: hypothetical protein VIG33_17265 [Pseudobdellovibrionaceae bacterium]|jgi:hypothetical protein
MLNQKNKSRVSSLQNKQAGLQVLVEPLSFQQLLGLLSVAVVLIYAFTWGYIYQLGIPESPDLAHATYFFVSIFVGVLFKGSLHYLISYNSFYQVIFWFLVGALIAWGVFARWLPITAKRRIQNFIKQRQVGGIVLKILMFFVLVWPPIATFLMNSIFMPGMVYSYILDDWILLDKKFIVLISGVVAAFIIPIVFPLIAKNIKRNIGILVWLFLIFYSALFCFYLSTESIEFMNFPIAVTDREKPIRYPHLWVSDKGRYIAACNESTWRLIGVSYENKEFFISDPHYDGFEIVCRYRTPWN